MTIETNLNIAPYFDDFDETKNFQKVLFRPEMAVQARELTQLQTILQNQIERFGDHVFNEGTIVKGCNFNYDPVYHYVKLRDLRVDLGTTDVSALVGLTAVDATTGLSAIVVNAVDGFETQNPDTKTIYVKYTNTGTGQKKVFAANDTLDFYQNGVIDTELTTKVLPSILDGSPTNPIGIGCAFSVTDGIIFQKGFFIRVEDGLTVIVSKYSAIPADTVVGFSTTESIITEFNDTSLYSNAQGYENENAPGAHRLKLTPTLVAYTAANPPNSNFFVLAEWKNGVVVHESRNTTYNVLGEEFARRTAEESGDYVVNPFVVTTSPIASNTTHLSLDTTQGIAYVSGYRVEKMNNLTSPLRKATDTRQLLNQQLVTNYGNYVVVSDFVGYFDTKTVPTISLRDTSSAQYSASVPAITAPGNEIGTARALAVVYQSGTPGSSDARWRVYLTNIQMATGKNFTDVRALSSANGLCDPVLESSKAVLKEPSFNTMIYNFGQGAIKTLRNGSNNNNSFVFRTVNTGSKFQTTGTTGAITLSGGQVFPYGTGTLNETQENSILIVPTNAANVSLTKAGTVALANSNTGIVTGTSTNFASEYEVGDYIWINTQARRVTGIANNTYMEVSPNFTVSASGNTHAKHYPSTVPIPVSGRQTTIALANTTSMSITLKAANGSTETLSANLNLAIYYDIQKNSAVERGKEVLQDQYIKIDCSNNAGNTIGPWSLGIPDVYAISAVYKANTYTEADAADFTSEFILDNGQRDGYYGLASIKRKPGTTLSLTSDDKLLVKVNVFKPNSGSGYGFYSVDSYPIDDANTANTTAITTAEIPIFKSPTSGKSYNLRDSVDFRPVASNNAIYSANAASATINPANTVSFDLTENYVAAPNETFNAGLEYYLARADKLVLDTYGKFYIVEGNPDTSPSLPASPSGTMTIATLDIAPYPSLSMKEANDYKRPGSMVSLRNQQIQRFTMRDLRKIERRVSDIEHYTALSLLEKKTTDLIVRDQNGDERFKNGIFVDDFNDLSTASVGDSEFSAIVDTQASRIRPDWIQQTIEFEYASGNNVDVDEAVTLAYDDDTLINQNLSSTTRPLGGVAWEDNPPTTDIYPPYDPSYHETVPPLPILDEWWWAYTVTDPNGMNGRRVYLNKATSWEEIFMSPEERYPQYPTAHIIYQYNGVGNSGTTDEW